MSDVYAYISIFFFCLLYKRVTTFAYPGLWSSMKANIFLQELAPTNKGVGCVDGCRGGRRGVRGGGVVRGEGW